MRSTDKMPAEALAETLTRREREILLLLAQGLSGSEIAQKLTLALNSVKSHIQHLYGKLGVNCRHQALVRAAELGLLGPSATQPMAEPEPRSGPLPSLPLALTRLIGREKENAEVSGLLSQARLVTLTGAGGSGKTRLALEAAGGLLDEFTDGVWLVELAPLADAWPVPQSVATALGLHEMPGRTVTEILLDYLRHKQLLLVLDNCEHLVQACAELAESLLRACARLTILATSREALNIAGETTFLVPTLASPTDHDLRSVAALGRYEAVRLFVDRAQAGQPGFELASSNARAVGQVCRQLDGIPLAIELAAAQVKALKVEQIAARLNDRFRLLTGGYRTAPPRHQTLQGSIDWSYDLLQPPEQVLLQRLAVFSGGWTLAAAETVCADEPEAGGARQSDSLAAARPGPISTESILQLLTQLASKSLVIADREPGGEARYHLLETIRQYALVKLEAGGEAGLVRRRHVRHYLACAQAEVQDHADSMELHVLARADIDNLRAALAWSQTQSDTADLELELAWVIHQCSLFQEFAEYIRAAEHALVRAREEKLDRPLLRGQLSHRLGHAWAQVGNFAQAEIWVQESIRLFRELGDPRLIAGGLFQLGWLARERDDTAMAAQKLEESLAIYQALDDQHRVAVTSFTLGEVVIMQGDYARAAALIDPALVVLRSLGDQPAQGWALNHQAHIAQLTGDYARPRQLQQECQAIFRSLTKDKTGQFEPDISLGLIALACGDPALARTYLEPALAGSRQWGMGTYQAWCMAGLAGAAALEEDPHRAVRLWSAAERARLSIGSREAPAAHDLLQKLLLAVRQQLGEAAFTEAWTAGAKLTLEQAVAEALAGQDE